MSSAPSLKPIHPGEILHEEFLSPLGISQYRLAKDIGVSPRRINEIVHSTRSISADTALRLGHFFGMSPFFWMQLQMRYDIEMLKDKKLQKLYKSVKVYERDTRSG
jgi:antitoxin HigA-1